MKLKDFTFLNCAAGILILLGICLLVFCKTMTIPASDVCKAMVALCGYFLFGSTSGSKSKDEATQSNHSELITALKESSPSQVVESVKKN